MFGGSRVKLGRWTGGLTDVDVLLCAGLEKGGLVCVCQLLPLKRVDLSAEKKKRQVSPHAAGHGRADLLLQEITFGADNDTGQICEAAKVYNLIVDDLDHVERVAGGDGVDEDVAMDADGVLGVEGGVLVLACGIDDVAVVLDTLVGDALCKGGLYGGVVGIDKVVLATVSTVATEQEKNTSIKALTSDDLPTEREPSTAIFLFLRPLDMRRA